MHDYMDPMINSCTYMLYAISMQFPDVSLCTHISSPTPFPTLSLPPSLARPRRTSYFLPAKLQYAARERAYAHF